MTELLPPRMRPSWLSVANLIAGIQVAMVVVGLIFWVTQKADQADAVTAAMVGVNSRLDRLFDKMDIVVTQLPVLQEKVSNLENQVTEARGAYNTMRDHLDALDHNEAANHADAARALGRKP